MKSKNSITTEIKFNTELEFYGENETFEYVIRNNSNKKLIETFNLRGKAKQIEIYINLM